MTDHNEASAADAGAQDVRSAVAAALNEREDAQPAKRDDVTEAQEAAPAEAGADPKPTDGTDGESSQQATAGSAHSLPDKGRIPPGRWSASQKEMFQSLPEVAQR